MADDPVIPSPNDAPYVPTSEGMPSLPAAPGDYSETAARDPTNPWVPLTSAKAATERQRLNYEEGRRATLSGAARLTDLQRMATGEVPSQPEPSLEYVPGSETGMPSYQAPQIPPDQIQENARRELEQIRADMIAYRAMPTFSNPVEAGLALSGQAAAALTSPENYANFAIRPFTMAYRLAHPVITDVLSYGMGQAAVQAAVDPISQAAEIKAQLRKDYDPLQTAYAGAGGFLLGGGFGFAPHAAEIVKSFFGYPGAKALAEKTMPKVPPEVMPAVEPKPQRPPGANDFIESVGPNYQRMQAQLEEHQPAPGYVRLYKAEKPGAPAEKGRVEFTTNPAKAAVEAGPDGSVSFIDLRESVASASRDGDRVSIAESIANKRQPVGEGPSPDAIPDPDAAMRTEATPAGAQGVIPGAERIGMGEQAQRAADRPMRAGVEQREAGGLFGEAAKQKDLLDEIPKAKAKPPLSFTQFVRQQGGLKPSPELNAIYGRTNLNVIRKKGLTLEELRERAYEAGYLQRPAEGMPEDSGVLNRILDMLADEDKGTKHVPMGREADVVQFDPRRAESESEIIASMQEIGLDPRARENKDLFDRAVEIHYREGGHADTAIERAGSQLDELSAREAHYARPSETEVPFDTGPAREARASAEAGEPGRTWAGELPREVRGAPAEEIAQRTLGARTLGIEPREAPARPLPTGQQARIIQNLSDVMRSVTQKLEATVLRGEVARGASGQYNVATHIARIRESTNNGFLTWVHEVLGHHVEVTTGKPLQDYLNTPQNLEILRKLAGPRGAELSNKELMREGFASFMEGYITNRPKIEEIAPGFVRDFRDLLSRSDPQTLAALDEAHAGWQTYFNAPSVEVGMSHVVSSWMVPTPPVSDILGRSAFGRMVDKAYTFIVNRQHPMTLLKRAFGEAFEGKYGKLIDLPPNLDFERYAQMFSDGTRGSAFSDLRDGFLNEKTMQREKTAWYSIRRRIGADAVTGAEGSERDMALRNFQMEMYLIARRQLELRAQADRGERVFERGTITPYTDGWARQMIADTEAQFPHFKGIAEEIYGWNKQYVQKQYDHHLITKDQYDFYMDPKNHQYVPLNRDMRDIAESVRKNGFTDKALEDVRKYALGGSERNILSPLDELERGVFQMHNEIAENRIAHMIREVGRMVGGPEGAAIVEEVSAKKIVAKSLNIEENIVKLVLEHGLLMEDAQVLAREVLDQMGPKTRATLFSQQTKTGEALIYGKENGKLFALRVGDAEIAKGVVNVLDGMGPMGGKMYSEGMQLAINVLAKPAEILRLGATTTGTFVVKNIVRDAISHPILVPESKVPFGSVAKAARDWFRGKASGDITEIQQLYTYFGGMRGGETFGRTQAGPVLAMGSKEKYGYSARRMQNIASEIAAEAGIQGVPRGKSVIGEKWSQALSWSEFSEKGPRKGLFETVYEARLAQNWSPENAALDAAYKAQDILAFGRYGSGMMNITRFIPFLRSGIQGIDKARRMLVGGKGVGGPFYGASLSLQQAEQASKMQIRTAAVVGSAAALSVGLYYLNKDDPFIASLTDEQRANYWVTRVPWLNSGSYTLLDGERVEMNGRAGAYLFIPKPFELGAIFNFFERAMEFAANGDPKYIQKFVGSLGYSFNLPSQVPFYGTIRDLDANYDSYFQRPIVPDKFKGLAPHEQANDYTFALNKYLANILASHMDSTYWHKTIKEYKVPLIGNQLGGVLASVFSPIESQYVLERSLGGWPRELGGAVGIGTALWNREPPDYLGGIPGVRALVRDLNQAGEPMREIYNQISQNESRLGTALRTYKYNVDNGDVQKATAYLNSLDGVSREYVELKVNPAGGVGLALHPAERAVVLARVINGLKPGINSDAGVQSISDPSVRIKIDPVYRKELSGLLTQIEGIEGRNGLIIQGAPGYKHLPIVDTAPALAIIEKMSPELYQEFTGRLAQNRVLPVETVAKHWPEIQRILKIGGPADEVAADIKGVASEAFAGGTLGGGSRVGTRSYDAQGQRVKRGKKTYDLPQRVAP